MAFCVEVLLRKLNIFCFESIAFGSLSAHLFKLHFLR